MTDNAANMKAAFRDRTWIGCAGHNLNLVLSHGLQPSKDSEACENGLPGEVIELITTCKELVTIAKRTKINRTLKKTLKQCVVTRWNSVLLTLKSIAENTDALRAVGSEPGSTKQLLTKLCAIDEELLTQVVSVLEPFDQATKELSTDSNPSLH